MRSAAIPVGAVKCQAPVAKLNVSLPPISVVMLLRRFPATGAPPALEVIWVPL